MTQRDCAGRVHRAYTVLTLVPSSATWNQCNITWKKISNQPSVLSSNSCACLEQVSYNMLSAVNCASLCRLETILLHFTVASIDDCRSHRTCLACSPNLLTSGNCWSWKKFTRSRFIAKHATLRMGIKPDGLLLSALLNKNCKKKKK